MKKYLIALLLTSCSSLDTPDYSSQAKRTREETSAAYTPGEIDSPAEEKVQKDNKILLSWPLRGTVDFSRGFITGINPHQGIDLAVPKGTPVKAAHMGYVEYAGRDFSGYGNLVILNSGQQWSTFYAHLSKISVVEGQSVKRGQTIGKAGATGNARGVHLHFELRYKEKPIDPMKYLPE